MSAVSVAVAIGCALAITWAVLVAALVVWRPHGVDLAEAKRLVPDIVRLLRSLARDPASPPEVRRWLVLLLAYLAMPVDIVPDFVPLVGYADDVIVVALVLRSVVRRAGPEAVTAHWTGTGKGLAIVRSLANLQQG